MVSVDEPRPGIAIVGGGLGGLSLACGLAARGIPFTLYEGKASFTEIGAGLNAGPNLLKALDLIDASLGSAAAQLCNRNPPPNEDVWLQFRLGSPASPGGEDIPLFTEVLAPPAGNMTVRRNDLLNLLVDHRKEIPAQTQFKKKLVRLEHAALQNSQTSNSATTESSSQQGNVVTLHFEDGSSAAASAVIAFDGIHSTVRKLILNNPRASGLPVPAAEPQYSRTGAYRALIPMEKMQGAVGKHAATHGTVYLGRESGYLISYPVEKGSQVNVGLWQRRPPVWEAEVGNSDADATETGPPKLKEWRLQNQRKQMWNSLAHEYGPTVHRVMELMGDPELWATHHHTLQPESWVLGPVGLAGDAAHAMPPHQGQGAGQAVEDAAFLSEILSVAWREDLGLDAALAAYEQVRRPRSQRVLETSHQALDWLCGLYARATGSENEKEAVVKESRERFEWIWYADLQGMADRAVQSLRAGR